MVEIQKVSYGYYKECQCCMPIQIILKNTFKNICLIKCRVHCIAIINIKIIVISKEPYLNLTSNCEL